MLTTYTHLFMTKKLDCPLEGCHATIEAETEQEVMAQVEEHANSSHPELELDNETVETIRSNIRDV
jgi:predicted small metal-binding protein